MRMPKILWYTLAGAGAIAVIGLFVSLWLSSMQVSPAAANKICTDFLNEVKSDVMAAPGYTVINSHKECAPQEDEVGFTDYKLSVTLRVAAKNLQSEAGAKSSMKALSDALPKRNYPIGINNLAAKDGQLEALCVGAFRYLDNDGKDVPQGPPNHTYNYTAPGTDDDFTPCRGV
jgi:hypothetical protein